MSNRTSLVAVLTRRRLFETVINPGFYLALALGLMAGYVLTREFVRSVDSSGPTFLVNVYGADTARAVQQSAAGSAADSHSYDLIARALVNAFGGTYVANLFAEGPFRFALIVGWLPVFLFLASSTVFRFGFEKNVGALELVVYGPVDGTSYLLAFVAKDMLLLLAAMGALVGYFAVLAAANNLVLGPAFFLAVLQLALLALVLFSYGILASVLTENAASSLALFLGVAALFAMIHLGSYTIVGGYLVTLSRVASRILQWISPLFFWSLTMHAWEEGRALPFAGGLLLSAVLAGVALTASHFALRSKGVRA